jgi:uncharacterized membrane protein
MDFNRMVKVTLFTRESCQLCDQVEQDLEALQAQIPHRLITIDIDSDPALQQKYKDSIPIVEIGPYTLRAPITSQDLQISLSAARDGQKVIKEIPSRSSRFAISLNRIVLSFARHWLAFINFFIFLYIGLPTAAPLLMHAGATGPAMTIYKIYSPMCHQLAYRSWFLFGDQAAYPIETTNGFAVTYEEISGLKPNDLNAARDFIGNEQVGYKIALCQRDMAIYGGILLFGIVFAIFRKHVKPISMLAWFLIGIVPVALDGGSQLLSSLSIFSFMSRESTPLLRTLTGSLFGVMNAWLAFPYLEESMIETQAIISAKLASADKQEDLA